MQFGTFNRLRMCPVLEVGRLPMDVAGVWVRVLFRASVEVGDVWVQSGILIGSGTRALCHAPEFRFH